MLLNGGHTVRYRVRNNSYNPCSTGAGTWPQDNPARLSPLHTVIGRLAGETSSPTVRGGAWTGVSRPESPPKSPPSPIAQLDGQVENPLSDKFRRVLEGVGASIEGGRDSRCILRVLRNCSVHPQGPSLHSEPFIGTDARLVPRRNKRNAYGSYVGFQGQIRTEQEPTHHNPNQ